MQKLMTEMPCSFNSLNSAFAASPSAGQMANCLIPFAAIAWTLWVSFAWFQSGPICVVTWMPVSLMKRFTPIMLASKVG